MELTSTRVNELREQARKLTTDAAALLEGKDGQAPKAEDLEKANKMFDDAKDLRNKAASYADLLAKREEAVTAIDEAQEPERAERTARKPGQFKDWREFINAVRDTTRGRFDERLLQFDDERPEGRKVLSGNANGGNFLIPDQFIQEIASVGPETAIVRPRASVIPVDRRTVLLPVLDQTDQSQAAGQPRWFGGILFYWEDEAASIETSDIKFRQAQHTVNELTGYVPIANSTLSDSPFALGAFLEGPRGFAGGAVWMEDYAFLRGDGVGKPLGVVNAPATLAATRTGSGVVFTDLIGMVEAFWGSNGVWVANRNLISNLMLMTGPAGQPSYLWGSADDGVPTTLLGYPIIFTEKAPAADAKGDIGLYDFSYYNIVDRQAASIDMDSSELFRSNQTAFRLVHRVGGQPWLSEPITLQDGSTQASPFVALAANS